MPGTEGLISLMKILTTDSKESILSNMIQVFTLDDADILCTYLGVYFEDIAPMAGIGLRMKNLIAYMERRGRIVDLVNRLQIERPDVRWDPIYVEAETVEVIFDDPADNSNLKLQKKRRLLTTNNQQNHLYNA